MNGPGPQQGWQPQIQHPQRFHLGPRPGIRPGGPINNPGPVGGLGPNGLMGMNGPMGPNGPMGMNGPIGPNGPMGMNFPMGPRPPMGPINNGPGPGGPINFGPGGPINNGPFMVNYDGSENQMKMITPRMNNPPAIQKFEDFNASYGAGKFSISVNGKSYMLISSVCFDQNPGGGNCGNLTKVETECPPHADRRHFFRIQELNTWQYRLVRILRSNSNEETDMFLNGIKIMENLQGNPNVFTLIDWEMKKIKGGTIFHIVMEDVPLIFDNFMLLNNQAYYHKNIKLLWKKMLEAVKSVHSQGVVLSFLHPCSFAIVNGKFKIGIFDCATMINGSSVEEQNVVLKFIGSEVMEETSISFKTDVSMLAYTMILFGVVSEAKDDLIGESVSEEYDHQETLENIIKTCFLKNHSERPTVDELLDHMYLEEFTKSPDLDVTEECLEKDVKTAFNQGLVETDMVLISDSGEEIPCHKFILCSRSSVFKAMFDMKDSLEATTCRISIHENTESLQALVKYFYTDCIPKLIDDASIFQDLLNLAEKYDLGKLKQMCCELLVRIVDESNCIQLYILGYLHNRDDIKMAALPILKTSLQSKTFKESEEMLELMQKHPKIAVEIMSK